jgi:hypothetical protein
MSGGAKPVNLLADIYLKYPFSATASVNRITRRENFSRRKSAGGAAIAQRKTRSGAPCTASGSWIRRNSRRACRQLRKEFRRSGFAVLHRGRRIRRPRRCSRRQARACRLAGGAGSINDNLYNNFRHFVRRPRIARLSLQIRKTESFAGGDGDSSAPATAGPEEIAHRYMSEFFTWGFQSKPMSTDL